MHVNFHDYFEYSMIILRRDKKFPYKRQLSSTDFFASRHSSTRPILELSWKFPKIRPAPLSTPSELSALSQW